MMHLPLVGRTLSQGVQCPTVDFPVTSKNSISDYRILNIRVNIPVKFSTSGCVNEPAGRVSTSVSLPRATRDCRHD